MCIFSTLIGFSQIFVPIETGNRKSTQEIKLTDIGRFGIIRKARKEFAEHFHTGIDIQRPEKNYSEPPLIFPIAPGKVISKREDGPYSQLIIEHRLGDLAFWTLYEHISSISVELNEMVHPYRPIARFYTRKELDVYGWQFDHFHFEILKVRPVELNPNSVTPERKFGSYTLVCYDQKTLEKYFYNPIEFLEKNL